MAPAPGQDSLDKLARALAAAAGWWRLKVGERRPHLAKAVLDEFERHLCFSLAKLILRNAQHGISWQKWKVETFQRPGLVLREAATHAGIEHNCFPRHTLMWLDSTADDVHVHVRIGQGAFSTKVWPLAT
jgi:hypothetical protein